MYNRWKIQETFQKNNGEISPETIIQTILHNRGIFNSAISDFLDPPDPNTFTPVQVEIDQNVLQKAITRIQKAIESKESVIVYADYDADGVSAGSIMWETLHTLGANVMPYIPHRVEEGYGLSVKGIDAVKSKYNPSLIITVDHGITAREKVSYAQKQNIEVIVTDHHVKPLLLPNCLIVHTTKMCGAGVAWFVAKELLKIADQLTPEFSDELLVLACIGTIADMVPLIDVNRAIARYGLQKLNKTSRVGLKALIKESGLMMGSIEAYSISHVIAPRLNAMGRLDHALDALRLLCTKQEKKALTLSQKLGEINRERQDLTSETARNAKSILEKQIQKSGSSKLIFVADDLFNQGVIGLVAGKLVETYYRPAIVVARGEFVSKASARSIHGFNIIEFIRSCSDLLVDMGGHPMAAGFTVETSKLKLLQNRLEQAIEDKLSQSLLERILIVDAEIPLMVITRQFWDSIQVFAPFGIGNYIPVFASKNVNITDKRLLGAEGKHLKLKVNDEDSLHKNQIFDVVGFNLGHLYSKISLHKPVDIAYAVDLNQWNGYTNLQLKLKDIII